MGACSSNSASPSSTVEQTGQQCTAAGECYPGLDAAALVGTVTCMVPPAGGYCTHTCVTDADCCAVPGECKTGHPQVCTPFESTNGKYCMLSCEAQDVGTGDADAYCHTWANQAFGCASSGGGSQNRKVCKP